MSTFLDTLTSQLVAATAAKTKYQQDLDMVTISLSKQTATVNEILSDISLLKQGKLAAKYLTLLEAQQAFVRENAALSGLKQQFINATSSFQKAQAVLADLSSKLHLGLVDELNLAAQTITIPDFTKAANPTTGEIPSTTTSLSDFMKNTMGLDPSVLDTDFAHVAGPNGSVTRGTHIADDFVAQNSMSSKDIYASGSVKAPSMSAGSMEANTGSFTALSADAVSGAIKTFNIPHPMLEGKRLVYGSLEGPEHGVYARGYSKDPVITLPYVWTALVDPDSITVQLTGTTFKQDLWVERVSANVDEGIWVLVAGHPRLGYYYLVHAERIDVAKLEVEPS